MKRQHFLNLFFYFAIVNLVGTALDSIGQTTFVAISDMHISNAASYVNSCDNQAVMFQCYTQEFQDMNPKPAFVAASGDIANIGNGSPTGMYPKLLQYLHPTFVLNPAPGTYHIDSAKTIPIYFAPGNHEYYTTLIPPLTNATMHYYPQYLSPDADYAVNVEHCVIIFMRSGYDDNRPIWQDPNIMNLEGSGLSNAQCTWLRAVLAANAGNHKIIVMHHPVVNVNGTNSDGSPNTGTIWDAADGAILNNRTTLLNICDSMQVDVVLTGHIHQNVVADRNANVVDENWTGGTRYIQTAAAYNRSYRLITIDSAMVSVSPPLLSCTTTQIAENETLPTLRLYPNPAKENISMDAPLNSQIQVINMEGQIVRTLLSRNETTDVAISGLPAGLYVVKATTDKNVAIAKFVKQ
ncbi:MAG: T9SS type A sorting domain-containing protein [Bacteroidota bacterium]